MDGGEGGGGGLCFLINECAQGGGESRKPMKNQGEIQGSRKPSAQRKSNFPHIYKKILNGAVAKSYILLLTASSLGCSDFDFFSHFEV